MALWVFFIQSQTTASMSEFRKQITGAHIIDMLYAPNLLKTIP